MFELPGADPLPPPSAEARRRFAAGLAHKGQRLEDLFPSIHVAKRHGTLVLTERNGWSPGSAGRGASTFWCLEAADALFDWGPFEVTIATGDAGAPGEIAFAHEAPDASTCPDFNFHRWAEAGVDDFEETTRALVRRGARPAEIAKAGWIGSPSHANRRVLADLGARHPDVLDVTLMTWKPGARGDGARHGATTYLSLPDLVAKFAFLIDVEGLGYSGRLKYLLFSGRPVLLAERPQKEWFHGDLVPWTHYVPVRRDLGDLVDRARWCVREPRAAAAVGAAARAFAEARLTRAAALARWNDVIAPRVRAPRE